MNIPSHSLVRAAAVTAEQSFGQGILAVVAAAATLALGGGRLAVAAGNLGLHLSEHLFTDNALMVIFNVILRELPGVFLMYTRQHILGKGLLQQHITAVFFVLQDALDALC